MHYSEQDGNYYSLIQDITPWKNRENELRSEVEMSRSLFEASPVPLWEEDFSALKSYVDELKKRGIKNLGRYLDTRREEVAEVVRNIRIVEVNAKTLEIAAAKSKEEFLIHQAKWINPYDFEKYKSYLLAIAGGASSFEWEEEQQDLTERSFYIHYKWQVVPGHEDDFKRGMGMGIDVTEQKNLEHLVMHQATHDDLTGLLNRAAFFQEVQHLCADPRQKRKRFALFFIDLNDFKKVNDHFGHQMGDELLRLFAHRLKNLIRQTDLVARIGGDEFVLLQRDITHPDDLQGIKKRLRNLVKQDFLAKGHRIRLSLSIGAALYPDEAQTPDDLIHMADERTYRAKKTVAETLQESHPTSLD